jgi:hypothetical protein
MSGSNNILEIAASVGQDGGATAVAGPVEQALLSAVRGVRPEASAQLKSLSLDLLAAPAARAPLTVRAWVDRHTRTLAFASADALSADGQRIAAASAVFELTQG